MGKFPVLGKLTHMKLENWVNIFVAQRRPLCRLSMVDESAFSRPSVNLLCSFAAESFLQFISETTNQVKCAVEHKGTLAEKKDNPMTQLICSIKKAQ